MAFCLPDGVAAPADSASKSVEDEINAAGDHAVWLNIEVFSQILVMPYPRGLLPAFENHAGGNYIKEFIRKGDTVERWREMFTITGERDAAIKRTVTPADFVQARANVFFQSCPETFAGTRIDSVPVGTGFASNVVVLSCGTVVSTPSGKPAPPAYSESAVIVVIQGQRDFYTVQWARRGKPSRAPMQIDIGEWSDQLSRMIPISLCPVVRGTPQAVPC